MKKLFCKDGYTKNSSIGLLTDKTGSGKSFCVIGLLCRDIMNWNTKDAYYETNYSILSVSLIKKHTVILYRKINTNLIVVDNSINIPMD